MARVCFSVRTHLHAKTDSLCGKFFQLDNFVSNCNFVFLYEIKVFGLRSTFSFMSVRNLIFELKVRMSRWRVLIFADKKRVLITNEFLSDSKFFGPFNQRTLEAFKTTTDFGREIELNSNVMIYTNNY